MATVAGSIKSLSNGVFHAKDENGNDRILKVGDTIYENDTVYGDSGNSSSSKVEILLSGSDVIVLNEGQKQLIDSSLIETAFGKEELFFTRENLDLKADEHNSDANVVSDLRDAEFKAENNKDITEEDTAEGKEEVKDETTATGEFQARDGNATDIISDLRNAQFRARTQVFEDKSAFETESKDRLSSRENTDRPDYTNPSFPSITTPPPPTPPLVVTPSIVTPTLIIGKLSIDDTSAYESEGFLIFTVSLDRSVASPVTFNYTTSPITATSNGVDYTDVSGKITIPSGSTSVTIKVPITDDYLSDNGETIKINISNVVGNANITKPEGIGTILDNPVNNPENGTPNTPTETGGYGEEDSVYAIITGAVSVNEGNTTTYTVKLVDKDGNPVIVTKETEVTIKYTNVTTQDGDTEFNNNNTIIVKIPANGSTNTFTVESIDDYLADNGEKYNVAITKVDTNEFENVVIGDKSGNNKDVTTTILDNPSTTDNPAVPTDPTNPNNPDDGINYGEEDSVYAIITGAVSVNEGNTTTYTVKLVDKDGNPVIVTKETEVTIKYTNVTTQDGDTEFNNNNTIIVKIPANGSTNTFTVESIDDYLADNGEKYNVAITKVDTNEFENVVIGDKSGNNKDVTTTILDNPSTTDNPTVPTDPTNPNNPDDGINYGEEDSVYAIITGAVSVNEGNTTTYTVKLVDKDGNPVIVTKETEVTIKYTNVTTQDGDTEFNNNNTIIVKIPANGSTNTFTVESIDDYLADNGEKYNVAITKVDTNEFENVVIGDKSGNNKDVTTTILDNPSTTDNPTVPTDPTNPNNPDDGINYGEEDSVYAIITGAVSVNEGNTTTYTVKLVDKDGNPVIVTKETEVTIKYTNVTTQDGDTEFNNNNTIIVKIPANGSTNTFTVESIDDYLADNGEKYNVAITKVDTNEFENVVIGDKSGNNKDVTTTILDNPSTTDNPTVPTDPTNPNNPDDGINYGEEDSVYAIITGAVSVNEGNTTTYTVKLVDKDGNPVIVTKETEVTIKYTNVTTQDGDTEFNNNNTIIVKIPANGSTNTFTVESIDDYLADNGEKYNVAITKVDTNEFENVVIGDKSGNNKDVTTTILDNPSTTDNPTVPTDPTNPNNPDDGINYGEEDSVYAIITGAVSVNEGNTTTYTVKLVDKDGNPVIVTKETEVTIKYTNVTTQDGDTEFNNNNTIIVKIPANGSTNTFTVESIDDYLADNGEKYNVAITKVDTNEFENVVIGDKSGNNKDVTTTILDNPSTTDNPTVPTDPTNPNNPDDGINYGEEDSVYAIITGAVSVNEGNTTTYTVKLVDKDGNPVIVTKETEVTIKYTNVTTQDGDTEFNNNNTIIVKIPANGSTNTFTVESIDDYLADNGEKYNVAITKVDTNEFENVVIGDKSGNNKDVTTTILDNPSTTDNPTVPTDPTNPNNPDDGINYGEEDSVYAIITGAVSVNEGNTTTYTVKLVDKDGNEVKVTNATTVTVKYTNDTTQDGDTQYNNNNTISVTIPANGSSNTFTVESLDDYLADNGEKYNVAITKVNTNEFENVVIGDKNGNNKDVTTTILDDTDNTPNNPNDGVEANHESVIIKLIACDVSGNPILEADGKTYKIVNEVNEGDNAKYMALAFEPNTTTFTTETKLSLQGGTVTVDTANGTAIGVVSQTKEDGTQDFVIVDDKVVNVGVVFEVETLDDYISDNNETYTVSINSGSYTHPTTPLYENVNINTQAVTTTIKDNSNPINDSTPHDPNDTTNHNQESDKEIVLIKLFAADENGNVLKDGNGNYLLANEAEEGTSANYIAYAFENGTTTFNDSTKLSVQTGTVDISFQNNTATGVSTKTLTDGTQDFNNTPKTSINIGQSFSTEVFKDLVAESTEKYTVTIDNNSYSGNYESVNIDTNPVTTTIHDEKVFVKIEAITDTANEGGNLKYKVSIVNRDGEEIKVPTGKSITVNLDYEGNSSKEATENTDYTPVTSVTINAGTSYTEFEIITKDDYYAEGDEGLKIIINNIDNSSNAFENIASHTISNGATSDKVTTTGTIKDNPSKIDQPDTSTTPDDPTNGSYGEEDTVYAIITGPTDVNEGDTTTSYTVKLVDKNGNLVTVTEATDITITYTNNTTQNGDTQYNNENTITVTIPANGSSNTFTVDTIDDPYKDDGEKFKLTITDIENTGEFENVKIGDKNGDYKDVTTTIHDNSNSGTETDVDSVKIVLVAVTSSTTTIADITDPDGKLIIDNTNETPEGGNLYYMAVAVDSDGKPLVTQGGTVTINYGTTTDGSDKDATAGTDYNNTTVVSTTIGTVFSVNAKDDYYAEGDENFTVKITNLTGSPYESPSIDTSNDTVISTIKDNPAKIEQPDTGTGNDNPTDGNYGKDDTVYVKITKTPSTVEGGNLVHTITLVDKDGNPVTVPVGQTVTVNLTYTSTGNAVTDDDFSTIVKQITIIGGTNHTDFTNITKDDFVSEGDEVYTVTISGVSQSGAFENVAIATDTLAIPSASNHTTGTIKDGVILGTPVDTIVYEDGLNTSDTSENSLTNSLGITNPNADTYTVSFDKTITTCSNISNGKAITYSYNTDGTLLTATRAGDNKTVFTVELKKDGSGNDVYDFKLIEPMDHEYGNNGKNTFDMPFKFNVTSNGTTSTNQTFNVTVVDSVPSATPIIVDTKEDTVIIVRLADDDFKAGEKVTINSVQHDIGTSGIPIYEQGDTTNSKQIGSLTINSNGTVTFTPIEDYSNHDTTKSPQFSYTVKDFDGDEATSTVTINVKPVADTITITTSTPTMIEDDGNTKEGTHQVALGLTKPSLSKDQTDRNFSTGDHPEKNGEITLTFTNGDKVIGAKIFKADGITQVGADITTANQTLKIVIVTTSGDSSTIDYTYHHADITASNPSGAIYLTVGEYEALKIQHAEDNDTDIKINISATSYELNDSDKPLSITDADLYETTTNPMTVKINPATDNISLNWDTATGGSITQVDNTGSSGNNNVANTFTFTTKAEGAYFSTPIDLKAILTNANGTQNDGTPKGGDLDGSEKRTYTVSGIPEGTIITLGGQSATANALGVATIIFNDTNNKNTDPEFSMKLPEQYSGTVTGKITLSVQDKGVDSGDTAGVIKTAEVYFNVVVTPVADLATIQVSPPAVGYEDAGRDGGNTIAKDGTINANGTGGIPLAIKVSSDDKDGSEKFDVTISAIPVDAVIYYNGVLQAQIGNSITITNFDNAKSLVIIPPHNSDADFTLNVSAKTNDGASVSAPTVTTIDVIVKNVADAPVGTDLNTNINVNEDNQLNLKSIYTHPENLASYDDSEVLTVKIELPTGFTIASGSLFYIENGMYVVKASDISAGNIKLNVPTNFSGSADLKLTYVTTEKAGEGDSKTWDTQTVNIFVNPIADDVTVAASSTINEDADGSANKIDLKPSLTDTDGSETITSVKILASSVATGYELFLGSANGTSIASKLVGLYYELTPEEANSIYAKNTISHDADNIDSFNLTVVYTVKDTAGSTNVTQDFTHTHTVNVQAVTDAPTLTLDTITQKSGSVTISGSTVTVVNENSEFKVPVTTTSNDKDGSETVTKIVISGVPMGVEVVGGTYYGYSGSEHNGIWVISNPTDNTLDANGALQNIVFKVNEGADFEERDITITTYTKDIDAEVKSASQTIHINDFDGPSSAPGTPPLFDLSTKIATIYEDNNDKVGVIDGTDIYNLGKSIDVTNNGGSSSGNYAITLTDFPEGTTISGYDYSYEQGGKTYYVLVGTGNAADVETKLSTVIVTPPTDMNTGGNKDGKMTFSATISTYDGGTFVSGQGINYEENILAVTDEMTISINANNINEDGTSNLSITLSNPNDGNKTELIGNTITVKVTENWADVATGGGIKGTLIDSSGKYDIIDNGNGTYTITPKSGQPAFTVDTPITGLVYTPASNRDGNVTFEVSVQNKETGSSVTLDSTGNTSINVTPVIDVVLNASVVTVTGTEDLAVTVGGTTLANPVKLEITAGTFSDGSEKLGNIILDEVPNGFTVWYKVGTDLVMATNIGTTGGGTFDINPNITTDAAVTKNKWLVPSSADGSIPEVYINAPTNWSGDFDFKAKFSVSEQNLSTATSMEIPVTGHINAVADGVTIDPTMTFGDAFSWVSLNLNANMKDIDGSETMSLELTGLDDMAQFQLANGTAVNSLYNTGTNTWELKDITYDQINNIQFAHDKSVASVGVTANTVEIGNTTEGATASATFELKVSDVSGNFKLDSGLSLDFSKIDTINTLKNIDKIDLTETGSNKLLNLSLQDVLDMSGSSKEIKITGIAEDEVSFKNEVGKTWSKVAGTGSDAGFDVYSNSNDSSVKVKVEQNITDHII